MHSPRDAICRIWFNCKLLLKIYCFLRLAEKSRRLVKGGFHIQIHTSFRQCGMEDEAHDLRTVVILIVNHEEIFQQIGGVDIQIEVTYDVEATFSLLQGGTDELVENGVSFEVLFAFVGVLVVVGFLILDLEDVVHGHNQLLNAVIAIGKDLLPSCSAKILPM